MAKKKPELTDTTQEPEKEEDAEEKPEKSDLFTKIDKDARVIIDKYKEKGIKINQMIEDAIDLYDLYHSFPPEIFGIMERHAPKEVKDEVLNPTLFRHFKVIIDALEEYDKEIDPGAAEDRDLWIRAREEMKMMLIGKTTFNQLIKAVSAAPKEIFDKPFKSNVALALINWITGKAIKSLTLEEVLSAIQRMWVVANYFYIIEVKRGEEGKENEFLLTFKHRQDENYSKYWLGYFIELFSSDAFSFGCLVVGSEAFDEIFTMTVKKMFDKQHIELDIKGNTLEEALDVIKTGWLKTKIFDKIETKQISEDEYRLIIKLQASKIALKFWQDYFSRLLTSEELECKCIAEGQTSEDTITLTIKKAYEKEPEETSEN